jgi:hypothetical protein
MLKADPGAMIITDKPERICLALGVPYPDPLVIKEKCTVNRGPGTGALPATLTYPLK